MNAPTSLLTLPSPSLEVLLAILATALLLLTLLATVVLMSNFALRRELSRRRRALPVTPLGQVQACDADGIGECECNVAA